MLQRLPFLFLFASVGFLAFALIQAAAPLEDGRPSPLKTLVRDLFGGPSLIRSNAEILKGYRTFDATLEGDQLRFYGAAFTFLDAKDPSSFVPYNFAFDGAVFGEAPDQDLARDFYARNDALFSTASSVDPYNCVEPRADSMTMADGTPLTHSLLCPIHAAHDTEQAGMIGVIIPDENSTPLADGDAACRAEFQHWRTLPGFEDKSIVLCAIVDRRFVPDAYSATSWMDVIFYQQHRGYLYNMRADTRNFQRIQ